MQHNTILETALRNYGLFTNDLQNQGSRQRVQFLESDVSWPQGVNSRGIETRLGVFFRVIYLGHVGRVGWGCRFFPADHDIWTMNLSEPCGTGGQGRCIAAD